LIVSCFLFFQANDTNSGSLFWQLEVILLSNIIAAFCITFLIFVHWKKGAEWWLKISYIVFYVLLLTNYVILPLVNVGIFVFFIIAPAINLKDETIESYVIFINIICLLRLIEYATLVRRSVLLDARIYI
jgi:hypothetical protein